MTVSTYKVKPFKDADGCQEAGGPLQILLQVDLDATQVVLRHTK